MRKILHIGKFYPPEHGGMERVLQHLAEGSCRCAEVSVLVANTTAHTVRETRGGVHVVRAARLGQPWSLPACPTFPLWTDRLKADAVMLHVPNPLAMWSYLRSRSKTRAIVWLHSDIVRQRLALLWYESLLQRCLQQAEAIVVSSPPLFELPSLQPFRGKCRIIPYGIDLAQFALTPHRESQSLALRQQYGTPLLLYVGRLTYYKGLKYLLEAMRHVEGRLLIVGSGPQGRILQQQVKQLKLTDRVHFLGSIDHERLVACYHACDLFVLPSIAKSEAFGLVQLEAMAASKAVVSTHLPTGIRWVNQDGVTGLIVPPNDSHALAQAISRLLRDVDFRQTLGRQGRQRVEKEFTLQRMLEQVNNLFHGVFQNPECVKITTSPEGE